MDCKRIYRSRSEKILGGVCGGIAKYFNIDPVLVRVICIAFLLLGGYTILAYIIAWIIIPKEPKFVPKTEETKKVESTESKTEETPKVESVESKTEETPKVESTEN